MLTNQAKNILKKLKINKLTVSIEKTSKYYFASKKDKSKKSLSGGSATASDVERREGQNQSMKVNNSQQETPSKSQPIVENNVKIIETVANHKPPQTEDTVAGRYAHTLFTVASQENNLYNVYNDMRYIINLYENLESFRLFADNSGLNSAQIYSFVEELGRCGEFCQTTLKFCDLLGKNKRFMYIYQIAKKYIPTYLLLTKEEKITIISAQELNESERALVKQALESNPENEGKTFIIDYSVNPQIIGGLQMYTENKFMDLSMSSRIDKVKEEVNKLI